MGSGKEPAYKSAMEPRTKPIVFLGVWLYFGPTAAGAGILAYSSLAQVLSGSPDGQEVAGAIGIVVLCALYGVASLWALWSVTAGFLKRR